MPLPLRGFRPTCLIVPWAQPSPNPKQHLDRFIRFCRAHCCVQQTDIRTATHRVTHRHTQTYRPRNIGNNSLCTVGMRCGLKSFNFFKNSIATILIEQIEPISLPFSISIKFIKFKLQEHGSLQLHLVPFTHTLHVAALRITVCCWKLAACCSR